MDVPRLDYALARTIGSALAPPGPALGRAEAAEVVAGLRAAAAASVAPVAAVTGLPEPGPDAPGARVVDRRTWVAANVGMVEATLTAALGAAPPAETLRQRGEAAVNAVELGGLLGALSSRVLGQFLPFGEPTALLLVAPNVARLERTLAVDRRDFRLWVCLHEQTHRFQFAAAPWLTGYLARQLRALVEAGEEKPPVRQWRPPASLLEALTTPAQRVVFDRVTAVMSLLEGYADVMMDRVGGAVVPSIAAIRARFEGHRDRVGLARVADRLLGLDLKLAQYRDGAAFCRAVIDAVGVEGLNAVYESSGLLPTMEEIHAPATWLARVHPARAGAGA
nr:coenzyme F420 biosynthesis-associated protein [Propionibacterium sp.]